MKYVIDGNEYTDIYDAASYIVDNFPENYYDDMLDDCCEEVTMGNMSWQPSYVLYNLDPTAYRCGLVDYADGCTDDIISALEREDDEIYGFDIEYKDEEDDEDE